MEMTEPRCRSGLDACLWQAALPCVDDGCSAVGVTERLALVRKAAAGPPNSTVVPPPSLELPSVIVRSTTREMRASGRAIASLMSAQASGSCKRCWRVVVLVLLLERSMSLVEG